MDYETIEYHIIDDGIGMLSLNRPRRYNSVNQKMAEELEAFWRDRLNDLDTHVIVLKGNGDRNFCAGLDMKAVMKMMPEVSR